MQLKSRGSNFAGIANKKAFPSSSKLLHCRECKTSHLKAGNQVSILWMVMGLCHAHARVLIHIGLHILFIAMLAEPTNSSQYQLCEPVKCGEDSGPEIRYPFYIPGKERDLCGYPGFEILCQETKAMYGHYSVEIISYEDQSIHLVDQYVMDAPCFTPRPSSFYPINPILEQCCSSLPRLWFFYNCTDSFSVHYPTIPVNCTSNPIYNSFVALIHPNDPFHQEGGACQSSVAVTVELKEGLSNQTIGDVDYKELLKEGFILEWDLLPKKSCNSCRQSSSRCGLSDERHFWCYCPDGTSHHRDCNSSDSGKAKGLLKKGAILASVCVVGVAATVLACLFIRRFSNLKFMVPRIKKMNRVHKFEVFLENHGMSVPGRYSYAEIKRMTNSFKEKLGQGGYGSVCKGNLPNGRLVAVKILSKLRGDGEEFINEVNSISRTSHVNIVNLLGFRFHKTKRALVYEFMVNGSLEKFIYEENYSKLGRCHLGWDTLHQISLGIAQGLEYLHRGCNSRILHFDIKPHNILLDDNYRPKSSDFGLAKICHRDKSTISLFGARGTVGFIAPEVFCRNIGGISHKSDVYSFGMTVLEMVGGRKNIAASADRTSEIYFPHWIHNRLELQEELGLQNIVNEGDREKARKMLIVSLWCIQTNPSSRPTMSEVVDMLRGSVDCLQVPPKPYLSSPSRSSPATSMSMIL